MTSQKYSSQYTTRSRLEGFQEEIYYHRLNALEEKGLAISSLPFSIKILLEAALRGNDGFQVTDEDVTTIANWVREHPKQVEIAYKPGRVVMQDFTGVPSVVDMAALRSAMVRLKGDPKKINPLVRTDLVIDHSVQVDSFARPDSFLINAKKEFERNRERYEFLKWGQQALDDYHVVPPATGIVHQVNLEYLASGVLTKNYNGKKVAYPDSLVGTDSHTTMIGGLGVLGWGVGGIEAEAVMLGQPIYMLMPEVIGFKLTGKMPEGTTATDLTLTVTQILRKKGVVGKFVEFFGAGLSSSSLADRATIANMAPEYGATIGFFPMDEETLRYLRMTGRSEEQIKLVELYAKAQGLFRTDATPDPIFSDVIMLDLSTIEPCMAGPKRPQDRILLKDQKQAFATVMKAPVKQGGFEISEDNISNEVSVEWIDQIDDTMRTEKGGFDKSNGDSRVTADVDWKDGRHSTLRHGSVVIAAITSCTNTSNPSVMLAAGLVAKKANERGLCVPRYVKTSLAPGSQVVTEYLQHAKLLPELEKLGFNIVAYGCTTCIGNSGPLPEPVVEAIRKKKIVAAAVLSGNRNFEGRVNPHTLANYLASPPLVVAYALAGRMDIDITSEPIGKDRSGQDVYLKDIWPTNTEIRDCVENHVMREMFQRRYAEVYTCNAEWNAISGIEGELFNWNKKSTYIQEPDFFREFPIKTPNIAPIERARVLALFGDSITTDHISPAGSIATNSPAGHYLIDHGVSPDEFNSYGSRRGNHEVMVRGTFANIRIKNRLIKGKEGGYTLHFPDRCEMTIFEAAEKYQREKIPLIVIAGKEYGTGSSRDWAAKGPYLLGVKAVIAESFERIHRSNLVGMWILPLQFKNGESAESLGLTGEESFTIKGLSNDLKPRQDIEVEIAKEGKKRTITCLSRIDSKLEVSYYRNGGILHTVLRNML